MPPARILIVEDETLVAQGMSQTLTRLGYEVAATISSGQEAVDQAGELRPDLVLMDVRLEGEMDGIEAAGLIRARFDIPTVYLTAHADEETLARARLTEPGGYLLKPFRTEVLCSTLEMALYKHQAERKLQESEEKYRALYENTPLPYQSLDEEGRFLDVNPAWLRTLGYEREEVIGQRYADFLHPTWKPHFEKNFPEFKRRGYVHDVQFRIRHRKGHYLDISFEGCIGYWPDGSFRQTYCVFQDITERLRAEEAYRTLVDHSLQGLIILQDGRVTFANPAIAEMSGYTIDELLSLSPEEVAAVVHPDDRERILEGLSARIMGEEVLQRQEFRFLRKDGTVRWTQTFASGIDYQDRPAVQVAYLDVTEQRKAEEALRKSEKQLAQAQRLAHLGSWTWNVVQDSTVWSEELYHIFGVTADRFDPNAYEAFLECIHPQDRARVASVMEQALNGETPFEVEYRIVRPDGVIRHIQARGEVIRDEAGRPTSMIGSSQDVTKQVLAAEALRESEEKYRSLYEIMAQGAFYQRADGALIDANPAALEMFGLSRDEFLARTSHSPQWQVFAEGGEPLPAEQHPSMVALRTGKAVHDMTVGVYNPRKKGRVWLTINAIPQFQAGEDEPYQVLVTMHDVTGRVRAEEAMRASEERFKSLYEAMTEGVCLHELVYDAAGNAIDYRIIDANPSYERVLSLDKREVVNKLASEIYGADAPPYLDIYARVAQTGEAVQFETYFPPMNKHFLISVFSPGKGQFATVFKDTTERVQAEEALKRRAAQLVLLNDVGSQIAAELDLDLLLSQAVRLVQATFGYHHVALFTLDRERAVLAMRARAGDFEHLFRPDHQIALGKGLVGWVGTHGESLLVNDVSQEPRYINLYPDHLPTRSELAVPIRMSGEVGGVLDVQSPHLDAFDENDVRVIETVADQLAAAIENARLFRDIQAAYDKLKETQAQLVQSAKLAAIGELAAGVAHEINNPLTSILGFAELATLELAPDHPGQQELQVVVAESRRARDIVRNLLEFARQTQPLTDLADANLVLRQTLALIRTRVEREGVIVEEQYDSDLARIPLDTSQMKQVFLNLITNAAQAMPGGGTLTVKTTQTEDQVAIEIADTGRGIPPEDMERLFEPFFTTKPSGTGLGLSVSLGIVQQHGGRIEVESRVGEGTKFTLWLPASRG